MGTADIEACLTHLAVQQKVAASTQNQSLSALLFLYRDVLRQPLNGSIDAIRARKPKRLPTVLTKEEALQVIDVLSGTHALMGKLLYGTGMRLMERLRLRVKDLEVAQQQIILRGGKGLDDRVTMLPTSLNRSTQDWHGRGPLGPVSLGRRRFECTNVMWTDLVVPLQAHLAQVQRLHAQDVAHRVAPV